MTTLFALLTLALPPDMTRLVGTLTEEGDRVCKDHQVTWVNPHFEVGFVRITDSKVDLKPFEGKPVLLVGRVVENYTPPAVPESGPCPVPQMREDRVWSKSGMRLRHVSPPFRYFAVERVHALRGLTAEKAGKDVVVRFEGIDGPAEGTLTLHYEGCYGKPGTLARSVPFENPSVKAAVALRAPALIEDGGRHYLPHSVVIQGKAQRTVIALDLPLSRLGVRLRCPGR